jgi:hypothetical protein
VTEDFNVWADAEKRASWFGRFLDHLKAHGRLAYLPFTYFERYPYDGSETPWKAHYVLRGTITLKMMEHGGRGVRVPAPPPANPNHAAL